MSKVDRWESPCDRANCSWVWLCVVVSDHKDCLNMSCVHYKFSSKLNYDTVTFDGLHITLSDLKRQIMGREKLKAADCDLQITNAQTKEGKLSKWVAYTQSLSLLKTNTFHERIHVYYISVRECLYYCNVSKLKANVC